jgi:hypothetical protein
MTCEPTSAKGKWEEFSGEASPTAGSERIGASPPALHVRSIRFGGREGDGRPRTGLTVSIELGYSPISKEESWSAQRGGA